MKIKLRDNNTGEVFVEDFPTLQKAEIWVDNENRFFHKNFEVIEVTNEKAECVV